MEEVGCCGAYCASCKVYRSNTCRGCRIGYGDSGRDAAKAKCALKRCCMAKGFLSCADCTQTDGCEAFQQFFNHEGYKYKKYRESLDYIRKYGYEAFVTAADGWQNAYGRFPDMAK